MSEERRAILSRRDFLRSTTYWIAGVVGAAVASPVIASLLSPVFGQNRDTAWVDLGPLESFPLGLPTLIEFTRTQVNGWERTGTAYGVFVVRGDDNNARVFSNICTHLGCHVNWHPELQHYVSPCHDGHFDVLGRNISGPPPRPLDEYESRLAGGLLQIKLPAFKRTS